MGKVIQGHSHASMPEIPAKRGSWRAMMLAFALGSGLTLAMTNLTRLPWRHITRTADQPDSKNRYTAIVEARPLAGVENNISGLTYSLSSDTLFATINRPRRVVEIDPLGHVIRILPADFGDDLEGITHVNGDLFLLASEKGNVIWGARINSNTKKVRPIGPQTLSISFNNNLNEGIEGLSWDHRGNRLFLANEKNPLTVMEVRAFDLEPSIFSRQPGGRYFFGFLQ